MDLTKLTTRIAIIPAGNPNRPGGTVRGGQADEIVIHETGNSNPGANAEMHRRYTHNGGGYDPPRNNYGTSYHAVVDAREEIQLLPWDEPCYAAGDGNGDGNRDSVNMEICVNRDMDYWQAVSRAASLTARIMQHLNIPAHKIRQHNYRSSYGKDCPHNLRLGSNWARFLTMVNGEYDKLTGSPPAVRSYRFPETGITMADPFLEFWETRGGVSTFGYPIREPRQMEIYNGLVIWVQSTERSRLEAHPDGIKLGLVEAERLALKGE